MNEEIKAKWVTDLTSGDFEQGRHNLEKDGKFCCLGVLSRQALEAGVSKRLVEPSGLAVYDGYHEAFPSEAVLEWADLDDELAWQLAYKNDNGLSFNEIAAIIQEEA